jgi:hypothetical protein
MTISKSLIDSHLIILFCYAIWSIWVDKTKFYKHSKFSSNFLHRKLIYRIDINKRVVRGEFSHFIFSKKICKLSTIDFH